MFYTVSKAIQPSDLRGTISSSSTAKDKEAENDGNANLKGTDREQDREQFIEPELGEIVMERR